MLQNLLSLIAKNSDHHYIYCNDSQNLIICSDSLSILFHIQTTCKNWDDWIRIVHPNDRLRFLNFLHHDLNKQAGTCTFRFFHRCGNIVPLTFHYEFDSSFHTLICIRSVYDQYDDLQSCRQDINTYLDKPEIDQFAFCIITFHPQEYQNNIYLEKQLLTVLQQCLPSHFRYYKIDHNHLGLLATFCDYPQFETWFKQINAHLSHLQLPNIQGGYVSYPQDASTFKQLIQRAMSANHGASLHSCCRFTLPLEKRYLQQLQQYTKLTQAIKNNYEEFYLVYQPQVTIDGQVKGMEALLRWPHGTCDQFIPFLEKENRFVEMSEWLITTAFQDFQNILKQYPYLTLSINMTYEQLTMDQFHKLLLNKLQDYHIPHNQLIIEITENSIGGNFKTMTPILKQLQSYNIKIALDDFGTGYASLAFLKQMPIDIIKIDQCFIKPLEDNPQDILFLSIICEIAKLMNCDICLEGVETKKVLNTVQVLPIQSIQGYYFSRPLPLSDLMNYLSSKGL